VLQVIGWVAVSLMSVLIVASRKHYSVDVVIAWYVVPLVYWTIQRHFNTKRRFSDSAASLEELASEEDVEMGLPLKVNLCFVWASWNPERALLRCSQHRLGELV